MRKKMFILLLINTVLIGFNDSATFASNITVEAQSSNPIWDFSIKVFSIAYPLFLLLCLYFIFYGIRRIQSLHHGGFVNSKDIEYCREIPKSVNLELAYTSLYYCSHINRKVLKKGILTAFILQWANEDNISITNRGKNIFSIDLKDGNFFKKDIEQELYNILKEAAGNNNVIDNNELRV